MSRQDLAYFRRLLKHPLAKLVIVVAFVAFMGATVAMSVHATQQKQDQALHQLTCAGDPAC